VFGLEGVSVKLAASLLTTLLILAAGARADVFTPLASYEPDESDLAVTASAADPGLSVAIVPGGTGGAPAATDGDYVLRVTINGETDRKVEFRHNWSSTTYDLAGEDVLLADIYVASSGALPDLVGVWSTNWSPPDAWQPATGLPIPVGSWTTVIFDVSTREQTGLDYIWAFVLEDLASTSGVLYVDNLRFRRGGPTSGPQGVAALGCDGYNAVTWKPTAGVDGVHVYAADAPDGPFVRLTTQPVLDEPYAEPRPAGSPRRYYRLTAVNDGAESGPSATVSAAFNGLSDEALLDWIQWQTFRYFWDYAHPVSGLTREGLTHPSNTCALGGTGMGLMAIVVGVERGYITRQEGAARVLQILTFLDDVTPRYHGAWSHWIDGTTGATIPFGPNDDGGDLVETAYVVQGMLTVRQYFDAADPTESEIRARATSLWESVEWDWYRRFAGSDVLYWHWSPNVGWAMNVTVRGYNETMITYLLAIASPTHPMPASSFHNGWAGSSSYTNGGMFYGHTIDVGPDFGGPLFFTHYSHLGFDPRYRRDAYCNYFENSRAIALVHQAYSQDNPFGYDGYHRWMWGLTASASPPPTGYMAHAPFNDNGTIAPTAALSSMPFTPAESIAALRYMLDNYTPALTGPYGLYDALNPGLNWISDTHLAIDQGPIVVMIENHRTALCWDLFMANPEIGAMLADIGMYYEVDYDESGTIDAADFAVFADCLAGPDLTGACAGDLAADSDLDNDGDVDLRDTRIFQRLFTGP
jgi:hypothetical protein